MKKPLIAKWKQGVKVQGTNRSQNDGEEKKINQI